TLVELLVVIAIIGILAVVAVPALFKNINKAKIADVEADYSAIKSAVLSYYTDENKLPKYTTTDLGEYMDSLPTKPAIEGKYDIIEATETGSDPISGTTKQSLFLEINGANTTEDQMKKLISDMGNDMVYVKGATNFEESTNESLKEGKGIIIRIKMIDNTSSVTKK
ncbi:MAG: type II secretion system protein, partial [Paraclostridium sp.]